MAKLLRILFVWVALCVASGGAVAQKGGGGGGGGKPKPPPTTAGPAVLVLYDEAPGTEYQKLGFAYAIMLRNLLGHFDAQVEMKPVSQYSAGQITGKHATFYLGALYDTPLPAAFLADAASTQKPLVWFKYNLWALTGNPAYAFESTRGFSFREIRGLNAVPTPSSPNPGFFDTVAYQSMQFRKHYVYDANANVVEADPDVGAVAISDPLKSQTLVSVTNEKANGGAGETLPYMVKSANFWYVADVPFSFIGPRDRYLVFADLLHDMLGIHHEPNHQAMIRLEDVSAIVDPPALRRISDYLSAGAIPFSIAVIPRYADPLGVYNNGTPMHISLAQATNLRTSLDYALPKGGEIVAHGYTHQYGSTRNPYTGVSGDDFEFWNITSNSPVDEDSSTWALDRLKAANHELRRSNYIPVAWETPHYHASALTSKAIPQVYDTTYQRVVYYTADKPNFFAPTGKDFAIGQMYPYPIKRDYYGQRVLPESLGNIEYVIPDDPASTYEYTAADIILNAKYVKTVRDGFASFFFHPFWLDESLQVPGWEDFTQSVQGITDLEFRWTSPNRISP
jgi:uncharacterized protein YdaL